MLQIAGKGISVTVESYEVDGRQVVVGKVGDWPWSGLSVPRGQDVETEVVRWLAIAAQHYGTGDGDDGKWFSPSIDRWASEHEDELAEWLDDELAEWLDDDGSAEPEVDETFGL